MLAHTGIQSYKRLTTHTPLKVETFKEQQIFEHMLKPSQDLSQNFQQKCKFLELFFPCLEPKCSGDHKVLRMKIPLECPVTLSPPTHIQLNYFKTIYNISFCEHDQSIVYSHIIL